MKKMNRELLFFYGENARLKLKEAAALLQKSSQRLKYNLSILEKEKILYNPYTIVDYSFFGQLLFRVYFKGGYAGEKHKIAILQILRELPYIVSVYGLGGEFDLVVEILSPNASRFNKELKKLITIVPSLNNYKIVLNIVTHFYPRSYLLPERYSKMDFKIDWNIIVGGDRQIELFSSQELAVLRAFSLNPRIHFSQAAKETGLNVKTVLSTFKHLKRKHIVKGFQYIIDTNKLGISKHRLFLKLHNTSEEREKLLMQYFTQAPEIVQINKTIGDWDLEVDMEGLDKATMRYLILKMREAFADVIQTFNSMEFFHCYQRSFLPESLFTGLEKKASS